MFDVQKFSFRNVGYVAQPQIKSLYTCIGNKEKFKQKKVLQRKLKLMFVDRKENRKDPKILEMYKTALRLWLIEL